jgi:hypothetical protein
VPKASGILASLAAALGLAVLAMAAASDRPLAAGDTVLVDQSFAVFEPKGKESVGNYQIKAVSRKADGLIEITELFAAKYRGKKAEITSTILYTGGANPSPVSGTAETRIDGKVCLKGTVTVTEKTVTCEGTTFIDERTGEALNPPKVYPKEDIRRPEGILLFQSTASVVGPLLLPKEGETRIVLVEFPDDLYAPEFIRLNKDYRLARGKANDKGEFDMQVLEPRGDRPIFQFMLDKESRPLAAPIYGNWRLALP